jgi:hypothetical protein
MGRIRDGVRAQFFQTLRRALETDDGRRIAVSAVEGLLNRPAVPAAPAPPPYPDLGRAAAGPSPYAGTVFITARFRTGSTLLWNLFRHMDGCVSYYEPLNNRRWFDPSARGSHLDATHRGVDDYWREYDGLADLGRWYRESWTSRALYMDEHSWDPDLRRFFDRLVEHARPSRAVLQCNRIDFRLAWIRRQFPGAAIVHLFRHPRDQWCSSLVRPAAVPRDIPIGEFLPYDEYYLVSWARDLGRYFPLLDQPDRSAYEIFYFIWKLSYLFGAASADCSLAFEDLVTDPRREIGRLAASLGLSADLDRLAPLVTQAPVGRWREFADDDWFRTREAACEEALARLAVR